MKTKYKVQCKLENCDVWLDLATGKHGFMTMAVLDMIEQKGIHPEHEYRIKACD